MSVLVLRGDARCLPLPDACVDLIVTSPPYYSLRSYTDSGVHYEGQLGSEATPAEYVAALVGCTREWVRVLKPCGSLFVNLGDKYAQDTERHRKGLDSQVKCGRSEAMARGGTIQFDRIHNGVPRKSLLGLPWRYAHAATDQLGLILRAEIIWAKPNGLPESVTDRVRRAHEQVFHFTVRPRYYSAVDEIREPHARLWDGARNGPGSRYDHNQRRGVPNGPHVLGALPGSVWNIPSQPLTVPPNLGVDHFAAFPMELPRRIIAGWSPPGVCTVCGEGRRPVVASEGETPRERARRLGVSKYAAATPPGVHVDGINVAASHRTWRSHAITGYVCACITDLSGPASPEPPEAIDPFGDKSGKSGLETPVGRAGELPPTRPAIVLDPFGGTGTTALLAHALGRTGITIDRSADYSRLAAWRTSDPGELARALEVPKPPPVPEGQASLFDEVTP